MLIGYMRPYIEDQNCEKQIQTLKSFQCEQLIQEEHSSAKKRIHLQKMMENIQSGDKILVNRLFILADSTRHLVELLEIAHAKGAFFYSIHEGIDTSSEGGYSFEEIVKHLLDFQSDVISERTRKGLDRAKQKGVSAGRPKKPDENVKRAIQMYQSKQHSLTEIKNETGISKSTLYRYLER